MNIQQLQNDKLHIINWISELNDYSLVEKIKNLMENNPKESLLSQEQKNAIDKALISIEKNGTISHEQVMENTKKRFPQLFQK